jgi:Ni/Co efflux regulator RcnB
MIGKFVMPLLAAAFLAAPAAAEQQNQKRTTTVKSSKPNTSDAYKPAPAKSGWPGATLNH